MSSFVHFCRGKLVGTEHSHFFSLCFAYDCLTRTGTNRFLYYLIANNKRFNSDIGVVHVRDLNFVLRSEIFVNSDGQLLASHLILGCTLVYKT